MSTLSSNLTGPTRYRRWTRAERAGTPRGIRGVLARLAWLRGFGSGTWFAIVRAGVKRANKDAQLRFLLWFGLSFVAGTTGLFYALATLEILAGSPQARGLYDMARGLLGVDLSGVQRVGEFRELLWRTVYLLTLKVQLFWVMTTVSRVGPQLIAQDIRTRALPIYFSKPVTPRTYLLGKWLILAVVVGLVTFVPNLLSLTLGVMVTGGLATWAQTLHLAGDLALASGGIMVLAGLLILALSSLSADKRYVSVAWFALCILPVIAQGIINENVPRDARAHWLGSISIYGDCNVLIGWLFDMRSRFDASGLPSEACARAVPPQLQTHKPPLGGGGVCVVAPVGL
ncbi:MAG: hypothetical protein H6816_13330, partial [Phycisphaerales bacterium]|nr:hypothetical protein [Phycisphaerales bacterium]